MTQTSRCVRCLIPRLFRELLLNKYESTTDQEMVYTTAVTTSCYSSCVHYALPVAAC